MSWPMVKLGDICETTQGVQITKSNTKDEPYEGGFRYLYIADFLSDKKLSFVDDVFDNKKVTTNDLVMANTGSPGRVFKGKDGILSNNLFKITFAQEEVNRDYLYLMLSSNMFQNVLQQQMKGGIQKHLGHQTISRQEIPLPPLEEQKRIAAILDKADSLRRKRQQAIDLADDFLRSVFLDMFGDPVTNPKRWDVKKVKSFAKVTTGNTPSRKESKYYGEDIEWIKSDNINTPEHILTTATEFLSFEGEKVARTVEKGSTLITCIAGSFDCIGNVAFADRKVSFNQQINALTPKREVVSDWFLYSLILFSKKLIQNASTNSMKGMVSKGKLEEVELILPPLEKQKEFEMIFNKQIKLKQKMNQSCLGSSAKFNSLSQIAFAGEL